MSHARANRRRKARARKRLTQWRWELDVAPLRWVFGTDYATLELRIAVKALAAL